MNPTLFKTLRTTFFICIFSVYSASLFAANSEQAAQSYEKGLQAFNKGEIKEAVIHLKNAIQQDESYLAAYVLLGKAHLKVGDGASAEKELMRAIRLGADKSLTMQPLASALLIQNKFKEVLEQIPASGLPSSLQADLLVARGEAYLELRELEKAQAEYQKAQQLNVSSPDPYLGIAAVHIQAKHFNDAETQISRALDFDAKSSKAWQLKASIKHAEGDLSTSLLYYNKALEYQSEQLTALLGRAAVQLDMRQYRSALKDAEVLTEKYALDPRGHYIKYLLLKQSGKQKEAEEVLNNTISLLARVPQESLVNHASMLLLAGVANFESRQMEKAAEYFSSYVGRYPGEAYAEKMYGTILLAQGNDREAIRLFERVLDASPNDYQTLTLLGSAYANSRLYNKANEMFDRALQVASQGTTVRMQRALNELNFGKDERALSDLTFLFDKAKDARAGLMLVSLYFRQKDMHQAESVARKLVTEHPDNLTARNFLAVAQLETGKLGEARKNFEFILKQEPDDFPAQMNLAKVDAIEGKLDQAEKRLNKLLERKKNLATVMLALSGVSEQKRDLTESVRWAEKAHSADNKNISAIVRLGDLYLAAGNGDKALTVITDGLAEYPANFEMMHIQGRAFLASGKPERARGVFREMSQQAGFDTARLFEVARLQHEAGDDGSAVWSLRKAVEGDEKAVSARQALIEILIAQQKLEDAKVQLDAIKAFASKGLYARLQGDWYRSSGKLTQAVKAYENAFELSPDTDLALRLFGAYMANRQTKDGLAHLKQWVKQHPTDLSTKTALAETQMEQGNSREAMRLYEEVVAQAPDHAAALNNLANLYHDAGIDGALQLALKAQKLAPGHPSTNDTLGWILVRQGKAEEGLPHLRNAHARAANNPEISYHIAVALHKLNRTEEAKTELENLLSDKKLKFKDRAAAEKLLGGM